MLKNTSERFLRPGRGGQHGATLIVGLIMLIVLTLLAVSAIRSGTTNLRIAGNTQIQEEAKAAAQQAIEQYISTNFTAAIPLAGSSVPATINKANYTATIQVPSCRGSTAVLNSQLDITNPLQAPCFSSSTASQPGIVFASGVQATVSQSWCFDQQWEVRSNASGAGGNGADVTAVQGVALRVAAGTTCTVALQ